jgi:3-deoxy-D-manno-octulosonate 8-phosphate phosphatase (KDO 8-P phosphatase)
VRRAAVRRRGRVRPATAREIALRAREVRVVAVDLDGVLTDGRVAIDATGRESRVFHEADRVGIGLLVRAGVEVLALAIRRPTPRPAYARSLGLTAVLRGAGRGHETVRSFCRRRGLDLATVAYVGHDVLELPLAAAVGLTIAVADGSDHLKRQAHMVTGRSGGAGVVREIAEVVLRAQGKWASTIGELWRRWD